MESATTQAGSVTRKSLLETFASRRFIEAEAKEKQISTLLEESGQRKAETVQPPISGQRRLLEKMKQLELKNQQTASRTEGDETTRGREQLCIAERHAPENTVAETASVNAAKEGVSSSQLAWAQRRMLHKKKQLELLKEKQAGHQLAWAQRRMLHKKKQLELLKEKQAGHHIGRDEGKKEVCMIRSDFTSKHGVLVHGHFSSDPIDTIAKAKFSPSVEQGLMKKCAVRRVYRLHAIAWPHLMDGNSLVCVSTYNSGKTFAILPAVCSRIIMCFKNWLVPPGPGPVGIIICYSSEEVMRVSNICDKMLSREEDSRLRIIKAFDQKRVQAFVDLLLEGCALLVTTARAYKAIYDSSPSLFMRARVRVVAIDNFDRINGTCSSALKALRNHWENETLQMIVTSTYWHPELASFLGRNKNTVLCIGSYMEAALYARVKFQVECQRDRAEKVRALVQYIQKHDYRTQRTILLTKSAKNIESIVEALRVHAIDFVVCSDIDSIDRNDGFRDWDDRTPGNIPLLICLDELLDNMKVSRAQHIVHYSMPSSWKMFTRRFAASFGFYETLHLKSNERPEESTDRPSSLVLLDEINDDLLLQLVDLLQRYDLDCPKELSMLAQDMRSNNAIEGIGSALCPQLLALGACRRYRSCFDRHVPVEHDLQHELPTRGVVRLKVVKTISPVHFSCWITDSDSNGDFTRLTAGRSIYEAKPAYGQSNDLTVDVRIAGVVPSNNDEEWSKYSIEHAEQLIKDHSNEDHCYIYGNVLLTLRNTIWIDELCLVDKKESEKSTKFTASLVYRNYGKRNKKSFQLIKQLIQKCKADVKESREPDFPSETDTDTPSEQPIIGVVLPSDLSPKPETVISALPDPIVSNLPQEPASASSASSFEALAPLPDSEQYSFDSLETGGVYQVGLSGYYSLDIFYIYILENVLKVKEAVKEYVSNEKNLKPLKDVTVGAYCLTRDKIGFQRAQITEITDGTIYVFLLDYGDTVVFQHESMFEIPTQLLRDFPFAANQAAFAYIVPKEGDSWTDDESSQIYDTVLHKYYRTPNRFAAHVCGTLAPRREFGPAHHQYNVVLTSWDSDDVFQIVGELLAHDLVLFDQIAYHQDCTMDSDYESGDQEKLEQTSVDHSNENPQPNVQESRLGKPGKPELQKSSAAEEQPSPSVVEGVNKFGKISVDHSNENLQPNGQELRPKKIDTSELQKSSAVEKKPSPSVVEGVFLQPQGCYRHPSTEWFQYDESITLYVSAPDIANLEFVASPKMVRLRFICNGEQYIMRLDLFGVIDAENAKYDIRGLNVVIHLPKQKNAKVHWPALLSHQNKLHWLKQRRMYDTESESESASEKENWTKLPLVEEDDSSSPELEDCDEED